MTVGKSKIVGQLAGPSLLLPDFVTEALAANGRIKFTLSWLQTAEASLGDVAHTSFADLATERALAGLANDPLYGVPSILARTEGGIALSQAAAILARMGHDLAVMLQAIEAGAEAGMLDPAEAARFRAREEDIDKRLKIAGDLVPRGLVSELSRSPQDGRDSLHGLVMEMHKAINRIATGVSEEDVSGAHVYHLADADKALVASFMRGLNRTAPLKFDHPGLATTAMHDRSRLVIQNDIGTTDAHVLIVYVEGLHLSVTYSDIHRQRLEFFERRLKDFAWTVSNRRAAGLEEDIFYLATGTFSAQNKAGLDGALEKLGASLVFLIDWNKARKSLRRLVSKSSAISILDWAADNEFGHRGYLEIGGEAAIADLLEAASKATGGFYISLQSALGEDGTADFLKDMLRISSEELQRGRSALAVQDMLRAELLARVASIADRLIDIAADHGALTLDLASLVQTALLEGRAAVEVVARRASEWEFLADQEVRRIRDLCGNGNERAWRAIASRADDAADAFEETAFRLQFLTDDIPAEIRESLLQLAGDAVAATKDYVRLLCALRNLHRGAPRREMRGFLELVERLHDREHASDAAEREVFSRLMHEDVDAKTLNVVTAIADSLEETADALLHAGRLVSDHALGEWFAV